MARRKGISSNTNKARGGVAVAVALAAVAPLAPRGPAMPAFASHPHPHQHHQINHHDDHSENSVPALPDKSREEFHSISNQSRYLHKKFKKLATVVQPMPENGHKVDVFQKLSVLPCGGQSSPRDPAEGSTLPATMSTQQGASLDLTPNHTSPANDASSMLTWHSSTEIDGTGLICKDYDERASVVKECSSYSGNTETTNVNGFASKKFESGEYREACESNSKDASGSGGGRHVCPYCKLNCAKPSVLQKHIRAHTNERPYPCIPCGFAFKTKSNLYKHCRSRSHALRLQGTEEIPNTEEDWSLGSEADLPGTSNSRPESTWSSDKGSVQGDSIGMNDSSPPDLEGTDCVSPSNMMTGFTDCRPKPIIYKPKFHKAAYYQEEEESPRSVLSPNPEFLNRHISKIISDNEAIVDTLDSPLHRRYSKDNINQKHLNEMISIQDSLNCENQPLNLTKNSESEEANHRKRCCSESFAQPESLKGQLHPLNPEGSIIKDLLLKARAQESGLLPVTSEDYDASETLYICPLCNIRYRSAENLEIHTLYYCKGNIVSSNSMLNGLRDPKFSKPEHGYVRSNSVHVTLPETYNPNSLVKLASTTLKSPLERGNKPENIVIHKNDFHETVAPLPSPGPLLGNTRLINTNNSMDTPKSAVMMNSVPCSPIPSLKRHTESQSSDYFCRFPKLNEDRLHTSEVYSPPTKIRRVETPTTLRSLEELSLSPMRQNSTSLQMFGGEVKIMDNAGGTMTMRIDTITSQQSSTVLSQSAASPKLQGPETSNIVVRSGLHSGGTIVHNPPTPKEPLPSPHPQTPRLLVSMAPNITTPNLTVSGITGPNMTKFQFPPSESLSAYNLLTLPPISPAASPNAPATIFHAGKLIPYVPGMPGPNSLNNHMPTMFNMLNTMQVYKKTPDNITTKDDGKMTNDRITLDASTSEDLKSKTLPPRSKLRTQNHPIFNYTKDKFDASVKINSDLNPKTILVNNSSPKENVPIIKIQYEDSHLSSGSKRLNMPGNKLDLIFQNKNKNIVDFSPQKLVREDLPRLSLTKPDKMCEYNNSEKENASVPIIEKKILSRSEYRQFNFENLISKSEILNKSLEVSTCEMPSTSENCIKSDEKKSERSETSYFKKSVNSLAESSKNDVQKVKFLRPTSLPLKPGTFVPKRHHGITPNANTLPLISPETPRPAKAYGQLYLNGHAYTYLGLKCSARVYYCTLNRPQPTYVPKQHALSMYSNWQVCSESAPHPLGLSPGNAMALYDSRHRPQNTTVAKIKHDHLMTHSSQWSATAAKQDSDSDGNEDAKTSGTDLGVSKCGKGVTGGFESNEEYTYVRGRGRGRYVCAECGIRCKKPSMLKKHIRTHTDVRPFTCKHCAFSFKTKGNLTKHMKSKAHYKKCCELGISPSEEVDNEEPSQDMGESEEDTESEDDGNEAETESSDTDSWKSRLEHEAAHCLLSLWGGRPAPGLLTSARPTTYPYSSTSETPTPCSSTAIPQQNPAHTDTTSSVIKKTSFTSKEDPEVRSSFFPSDQSKPMDLSKGDFSSGLDILTPVGEPSLLISLARSTSKLPQRRADWRDDEPMLQAYLTEKALQDSRIKQSQYTNGRPRQLDINAVLSDSLNLKSITTIDNTIMTQSSKVKTSCVISESPAVIVRAAIKPDVPIPQMQTSQLQTSTESSAIETLAEIAASSMRLSTPPLTVSSEKITTTAATSESSVNTDNAKFVASEYLKVVSAKSNIETDNSHLGNASDKLSEKLSKEASSHLNSNDGNISNEKDSEVAKLNPDSIGVARKVVVGAGGLGFKLTAPSGEYSSAVTFAKGHLTEDGRSVCVVCNKTFSKPSQLRLHINIHYMERPFRCSACAVSFRTRGHLQKHERSGSHHNKVSMTSTFGAATTTNPRPFKCSDCGIAFRIHGHLAKHLRSKMHVMRLECLGKLPFGTFAEIERAGVSLTDIDTTDCDNSLASLQILAQKLHEKDPTKLEKWDPTTMAPPLLPPGADSSDEEEQDTDPTSPNDHITPSPSCEPRTIHDSDSTDEVHVNHSATDT